MRWSLIAQWILMQNVEKAFLESIKLTALIEVGVSADYFN